MFSSSTFQFGWKNFRVGKKSTKCFRKILEFEEKSEMALELI